MGGSTDAPLYQARLKRQLSRPQVCLSVDKRWLVKDASTWGELQFPVHKHDQEMNVDLQTTLDEPEDALA